MTCSNGTGMRNYRILPINDWALRQMIAYFGDRLTLLQPPVRPEQALADQASGMQAIGRAYVDALSAETGVRYVADFGDRLHLDDPADFPESCDHLGSVPARQVVARAIVDLLK